MRKANVSGDRALQELREARCRPHILCDLPPPLRAVEWPQPNLGFSTSTFGTRVGAKCNMLSSEGTPPTKQDPRTPASPPSCGRSPFPSPLPPVFPEASGLCDCVMVWSPPLYHG